MIIRVTQVKVPLNHTVEDVLAKACKKANIHRTEISQFQLVKKSVDARKKEQLQYIYSIDLTVDKKKKLTVKDKDVSIVEKKEYQFPQPGEQELLTPPVVIGAGPAGLFCGYLLAVMGYCPIILERGKAVEDRVQDVERFWETGVLDASSNVQFGEGGAGTFSDGKLNTVVKDRDGRNRMVLETFVKFGAPEDILYVNKPHIGTDILFHVIQNMRQEICRLGGSFCFSSCVTDFCFEDGRLKSLIINQDREIACQTAVLATGHSARDTFEILHKRQVPMESKPFAVGFRVEHPQKMINENQYHREESTDLPVADYKVTYHAKNGRAVYSFCMCPGGYVVNASSEQQRLAVNGMSYRARDSRCANSAIIMSVTPEDFPGDSPLAGVAFQRSLEETAYAMCQGQIPQQLFGDFEQDRRSEAYGDVESCTKGSTAFANLRPLLPASLNEAFIEAMHAFGGKIKGFDREDCVLSAIESRTSSPVRILRDEQGESSQRGLYPCGEGAGYAGGITSAAMDGLKIAEVIIKKYKVKKDK